MAKRSFTREKSSGKESPEIVFFFSSTDEKDVHSLLRSGKEQDAVYPDLIRVGFKEEKLMIRFRKGLVVLIGKTSGQISPNGEGRKGESTIGTKGKRSNGVQFWMRKSSAGKGGAKGEVKGRRWGKWHHVNCVRQRSGWASPGGGGPLAREGRSRGGVLVGARSPKERHRRAHKRWRAVRGCGVRH